jgi:hypothetical protein
MMPPECEICGEREFEDLSSALVTFAERPSDTEWRERMQATGGVGHPPNAVWFCPKHAPAAHALAHLTRDVAMPRIREACA